MGDPLGDLFLLFFWCDFRVVLVWIDRRERLGREGGKRPVVSRRWRGLGGGREGSKQIRPKVPAARRLKEESVLRWWRG